MSDLTDHAESQGGRQAPASFDVDWNTFDFQKIFSSRTYQEELEQILRSGEKYKMLIEIGKAVNSMLDLEDLLGFVLDTVLLISRMELGFLLLVDDDRQFRVRAARKTNRDAVHSADMHINKNIILEVARTHRPVYIADIEKEPAGASTRPKRNVVCFPLVTSGALPMRRRPGMGAAPQRVIGLLYVEGPMTRLEFPVVDLEFLGGLASQATVAIENARLYAKLNADRDQLAGENLDLRREVRRKYTCGNIIGRSEKMLEIYTLIEKVAQQNVNVLLRGESGTGKELFAKTLHYNSDRAKKPFVSVNCAALPESLLESELFGIEKGVATGVLKRTGKFEHANGGTFFLDEIGDMSPAVQAKFLRVLESREIERIGGKVPIPIDVRIIAATNKDLETAIQEGTFREDLYYRLNVVPIFLPPLRERTSDIPLLVEHFLDKYMRNMGKGTLRLSPDALDALVAYDWPGNVRELDNIIQRAVILTDTPVIEARALPTAVFDKKEALVTRALDGKWTSTRLVTEYAKQMLKRNGGNLTKTARDLGLDFKTLKKRLEEAD